MSFIAKTIGQITTALNPGRKEKALYLVGTDHLPACPSRVGSHPRGNVGISECS